MEPWLVLFTKPRSELRVARTLSVRGFNAFLPFITPRPGQRPVPLFPSYLFVRCDASVAAVSALEWTPGLCRVVSFDGKPAVIPDRAIDTIRAELLRIEAVGGLPDHPFKAGDEVIVAGGPLDGLRGIFQGPVGPSERVHILLHFLGQVNRTEVPVNMLRLASEDWSRVWRRRGTRGRGRRIRHVDPQPP
jgi:transcriptional antiterminator RfaH